MGRPEAEVRIAAGLRVFLAPRHRGGRVRVACDGTSSLGHVVESLGVPLPEVGGLTVNGRPVVAGYRLNGGDVAGVGAMPRPQRLPSARFLLDVRLGALARRLRLVGVDAAYANDLDDDTLIERANAGRRAGGQMREIRDTGPRGRRAILTSRPPLSRARERVVRAGAEDGRAALGAVRHSRPPGRMAVQ